MVVHSVGPTLGHVGGLEVPKLLQQVPAELLCEQRQGKHPARQTVQPCRQLIGRDVIAGPDELHQLQQRRLQTVWLTDGTRVMS